MGTELYPDCHIFKINNKGKTHSVKMSGKNNQESFEFDKDVIDSLGRPLREEEKKRMFVTTKKTCKHGNLKKAFTCLLCAKVFGIKQNIEVHVNIHTEKKLHHNIENIKEEGSLEFDQAVIDNLGRPLNEDESKNMFVTFEKTCKRLENLCENHTHYKCLICAKVVLGRNFINAHINLHTGKGLHFCSVCEKKFVRRISLEEHMRIHTGEKPYECHYRHKKFDYSSSLQQRIENVQPKSMSIASIAHQNLENMMVEDYPSSHSAVQTDYYYDSNFETAENEESGKTESIHDLLTCQFCGTDFLHNFELDMHLQQCCTKKVGEDW